MIEFVFGPDDVARVRFAFSPLWEVLHSVRVLVDPAGHALHLPWVHAVRPKLRDLDMSPLYAVVPARGYMPDFLTPPPESPLPDLAAELAAVRAASPEKVAEEIAWVGEDQAELRTTTAAPGSHEQRRQEMILDPAHARDRFADLLAAYWEVALAPYWTKIRELLEGDILRRAGALTTSGAEGVFADLDETVRWRGDRLTIERRYDFVGGLGGRGLLLVPSAFGWPNVSVMTPPYQALVSYPPHGVATLWESAPAPPADALAALIGRGRAAVLSALSGPAATSEVARRLAVTPGAVSQHIGVLRACGLVIGHRVGRRVLYTRTPGGDALVASSGQSSHPRVRTG